MTWYGRAFLSFKHYPCPKSCPPKKTKNTRPPLPSAGDLRMSIIALNHALNEALTHCTRWCLRATVATSQASLLSGEFFTISQRVELNNARKLFDNAHSFSIWLRTSVAGSYGVSMHNADASHFYKFTVSIGSPNVWQRVPLPNIPAMPTGTGSWGTNETDFSYQISVC